MIDLDAWLPDPQVRGRHRRAARATPDELWRAAQEVTIAEAPVLGRAVRWRIPGTATDLTFRDLLRTYPFAVLDEGRGWSVSGLCGRLWTLRRDYPELQSREDFVTWHHPGTARVLIAHWVEPDRGGRSAALCNESRISPVDAAAASRLRALWVVVGRLERLVGGEALGAAARIAERAAG
jgi:hypothetical protein